MDDSSTLQPTLTPINLDDSKTKEEDTDGYKSNDYKNEYEGIFSYDEFDLQNFKFLFVIVLVDVSCFFWDINLTSCWKTNIWTLFIFDIFFLSLTSSLEEFVLCIYTCIYFYVFLYIVHLKKEKEINKQTKQNKTNLCLMCALHLGSKGPLRLSVPWALKNIALVQGQATWKFNSSKKKSKSNHQRQHLKGWRRSFATQLQRMQHYGPIKLWLATGAGRVGVPHPRGGNLPWRGFPEIERDEMQDHYQ